MTVPRPTPLNFESGRSGSCRVRQESIGINHVVTVWHDSRVRTPVSSAQEFNRKAGEWGTGRARMERPLAIANGAIAAASGPERQEAQARLCCVSGR